MKQATRYRIEGALLAHVPWLYAATIAVGWWADGAEGLGIGIGLVVLSVILSLDAMADQSWPFLCRMRLHRFKDVMRYAPWDAWMFGTTVRFTHKYTGMQRCTRCGHRRKDPLIRWEKWFARAGQPVAFLIAGWFVYLLIHCLLAA